MKDRLKYVIDSRYFDGTCLTSMSDGFHNDYGGETVEELRIRENNPYLKAVTPSEMDKKLRLYHQSLSEPFKEITEEDYYDLLDVLPPLRMRQNSFFVGEPYYGNMYSFCFTRQENRITEICTLSASPVKEDISRAYAPYSLRNPNWTVR